MNNIPLNTALRPKAYALLVASGKTNCTRVCSEFCGSRAHVTFRDQDSRRLERYLAHERARKHVVVTTERGIWIP